MRKMILPAMFMIATAMAVMSFTSPPQEKPAPVFPEQVQSILENSCFDCHSDGASNAKAKMKLNLSKWNEMTDAKKVGKMEGIQETLIMGDMPPAKYIEKNPGKALTQEQKDTIGKWVAEESAKLMGP